MRTSKHQNMNRNDSSTNIKIDEELRVAIGAQSNIDLSV